MADSVIAPPKAIFLSPDGVLLPDHLVCSGQLVPDLEGKPCVYAIDGWMPDPRPLVASDPLYSVDKGAPGDLCPPCAKQKLGALRHWQGHAGQRFPEALLDARLFKCRMWFWLVVPGLSEAAPSSIGEAVTVEPVE